MEKGPYPESKSLSKSVSRTEKKDVHCLLKMSLPGQCKTLSRITVLYINKELGNSVGNQWSHRSLSRLNLLDWTIDISHFEHIRLAASPHTSRFTAYPGVPMPALRRRAINSPRPRPRLVRYAALSEMS